MTEKTASFQITADNADEVRQLAENARLTALGRNREIDLDVTAEDLAAAAAAGGDTVTLGNSSIRVTEKGPAQRFNMYSDDPGALVSAPQVAQIDNQIAYLTENLYRLADAEGNIRPGNEAEAEKLERQIVQLQFSRAHQVHVASAGIRAAAAQRSGVAELRSEAEALDRAHERTANEDARRFDELFGRVRFK